MFESSPEALRELSAGSPEALGRALQSSRTLCGNSLGALPKLSESSPAYLQVLSGGSPGALGALRELSEKPPD
eukprot:12644547-Alexandrium_andersonii.AAC.1